MEDSDFHPPTTTFRRCQRGKLGFEVTEDLDNPDLAFWGGVATGTIFVSLLICLKHLGQMQLAIFFGNHRAAKTLLGLEGCH